MFSTVAVGTDGSQTASVAIEFAADMARRYGARLVLLSAFQDTQRAARWGTDAFVAAVEWAASTSAEVREILSRTEADLKSRGIDCTTRVDEGDPAAVLVQLATECGADLLVVGSKGMHRRMLGSVPNTVTHKAPCSVLVVKTT
jgi:nucleotide-binding universal stress UspA family protein